MPSPLRLQHSGRVQTPLTIEEWQAQQAVGQARLPCSSEIRSRGSCGWPSADTERVFQFLAIALKFKRESGSSVRVLAVLDWCDDREVRIIAPGWMAERTSRSEPR